MICIGRVTHVVGVAGRRVDLPCDTTTVDPEDRAVLVLWYKTARASPRTADAALYRCRVDFTFSPTRNQRVNLTVIMPPDRPVILYNGRPVSGLVGPLQEGDPLELTCLSRGGRPEPRVTWSRDDLLLDDSDGPDGSGQVINVLRLAPLGREDLHTRLVCSATNNNISRPVTTQVVLDMYFRPLSVTILGSARAATLAGQSYELVCQAYGSRPPANLSWWMDGAALDGGRTESGLGNITSSTLPFKPRPTDNGREITCRAENSLVSGGTIEDKRLLNVRYAPIVAVRLGYALDPDDIKEGADVYFECLIRANPAVYSVVWSHDERPVRPSPRAGVSDMVSINERSLVIRNLSRRSAGAYRCRAANPEGEAAGRPVHLSVKYAPVCVSGQKSRYGTARNEAARVTCQVEASPADVTFRWQFNSSAETLDLPFSQIASRGVESRASYTPKTELDYGTLLCTAENDIGRMVKPCVFNIVPAGPPEPLRNCTVINQTSDSLEVKCAAGFDGGLPQYFVAELFDVAGRRLVRNLTRPFPHFAVLELPPGLELRLELYAANSRGRSRAITLDGFTLKAAEKRISSSTADAPPAEKLSVTPILGVLIGVVASLIIIAIGVVACMRNHSRRVPRPVKHADLVNSSLMIKDRAGADADFAEAGLRVAAKLSGADEANPDVVPSKYGPDHEVVESTRLLNHVHVSARGSRLSLGSCSAQSEGKRCIHQGDSVTYAELSLPRPGKTSRSVRGRDPGTAVVYATIDHGRTPGRARDTVVRTGEPSDQRESVV
ncbi:nephrin-like [Pollicipes pollicipes]|uniref:nephrin-like n=1 Tax=Pollicipes pollicipes TaxID=41117 RepID=UPI001884AA3F|nr:nephrin-like [Pollicipes pollicipes]